MILFALYGNFKFPVTIALGVIMTEPVGALVALKLTHTPFSVSSVLGLVALLGVSVETAVILVSYINKLRLEGMDIPTATREASLLRLRPIMMTALVACLGLLPAALSTGIGSATQKPFAIVIVAGLISGSSSDSSSTPCCIKWSPAKATSCRYSAGKKIPAEGLLAPPIRATGSLLAAAACDEYNARRDNPNRVYGCDSASKNEGLAIVGLHTARLLYPGGCSPN